MPEEGILRDFDLNTKFGPCCTVTRQARWQRAQALGLDPPEQILALIEKTNNNLSVLDIHLKQVS
jgi:DNA polymerase delta subunit 4